MKDILGRSIKMMGENYRFMCPNVKIHVIIDLKSYYIYSLQILRFYNNYYFCIFYFYFCKQSYFRFLLVYIV